MVAIRSAVALTLLSAAMTTTPARPTLALPLMVVYTPRLSATIAINVPRIIAIASSDA